MAAGRLISILAAITLAATAAGAAELRVRLSQSEVYVGLPFTLSVVVEGSSEPSAPVFPAVDGLSVGEPSMSTQRFSSNRNGRVSESLTVTFAYPLIATRAGQITIPALRVEADGMVLTSRPITITAGTVPKSDLVVAELDFEDRTYYLGETIGAALRVWVKPFTSQRFSRTLDANDMFGLFSRQTMWGPFADVLRAGTVREVERQDDTGAMARYYLYEFSTTIAPEQAGRLDLGGVALVMDYPEELQRRSDVFGRGRLEVASSRPVLAAPGAVSIEVALPPEAGRPPWYSGAVGRFTIDVSADPTDVAVGDPITLTLTISDRSRTASRLELLQAPPLGRVDELVRSFKVSGDSGAGDVDGRRKTFRHTIRAASPDVREIPALPFASFDPAEGKYVTDWSDPVPIRVRPASTIAMSDIVGAPSIGAAAPTHLTEVEGGLLANYSDPEALLARRRAGPQWWMLAALAIPPLTWAGAFATRRTLERRRGDSGRARARGARRTAARHLEHAMRGGGNGTAEAVAAAVGGYVADRCNLPAGAVTGAEVVRTLRSRNVTGDLVAEIEGLLSDCERQTYAGGATADGAGLCARARECIRRLEGVRLS